MMITSFAEYLLRVVYLFLGVLILFQFFIENLPRDEL